MKQTIKTALLTLLTLFLLLFILFVDTTFYHVPSFIKMFRIERELTVSIMVVLIYFRLKPVVQRRKFDLRKTLLSICALIISLFILVLLPQIILKKHLVLWDENPFLAEFPLIWNAVSEFCSVITVSILIIILILVKKLLDYRPNRFSNFEYRLLLTVIFSSALVFNFIENRYTFERVSVFQQGASATIWIIGFFLLAITLVISFYKTWADVLNKREKYIGFGLTLLIIPVGLYLFFSNLLFPVYAFSTTVKGFVLATLVFINIYAIASFIGLLFRLPTASIYDRVTSEIHSISRISKMISDNIDIDAVFVTIVENACSLTTSDACWLAFENEDSEFSRLMASINLSEDEQTLLSRREACCVGNVVREMKDSIIIYNVNEDERTLPLQLLNIKWKSMIAVPLIHAGRIVGILYSAKKPSYAYDENDLATLKSFATQVNIALSASPIIRKLGFKLPEKPDDGQIMTFLLDDVNITFPVAANTSAGQITLSGNKSLLFCVLHSDDYLDDTTEIKGVLKTLFTLEANNDSAYRQAVQMITADYSGVALSVFLYDSSLQRLSVFGPEHQRLIIIGNHNIKRDGQIQETQISGIIEGLQHFHRIIDLQKDFFILTGSAAIIDTIDDNRLKAISEKHPAAPGPEILQKIIPEFQKYSGVLFLINLKN